MSQSKSETRPYGSWKSPVTAESLVEKSLRLGQVSVDDNKVIWTEGRPSEKGRTALMEWSIDKGLNEVSQPEWDVRTRVHEYGGGAFHFKYGQRFYVDNRDQNLYKILRDGSRQLLTTNHEKQRFADADFDSKRKQVVMVMEDHSESGEASNMLVSVSIDGTSETQVIAVGNDFFSNPRISPEGDQLLFLSWDHPNMPWDGTQLWLGDLDEYGNLTRIERIAGDEDESVFQPQWDPNGDIYYISDHSGWWNIYRYSKGEHTIVLKKEAEFGLPQWVFGMSTYAVTKTGELVASYMDLNGSALIRINLDTGMSEEINTPFSDIDQLCGSGDLIAFIGSSPHQPAAVVSLSLATEEINILRKSSETVLDDDNISCAELLSYESQSGEKTHAWYYAPQNAKYVGPDEEKPPLIVLSHGGPTANSNNAFKLPIQFWTTRGFAVVDVNYSGSTGYGREYRQRLNGNWGIRDVEDCAGAAEYLVHMGQVDSERLIIKGGSAGGYTTLAALAFTNTFRAGASYYGVGDLELLAKDTHKFESRYLDQLVGTYPEEQLTYKDRSPINHVDRLDCPVIFLQGLDDPVVPPNQAEEMVQSLRNLGVPVAYIPFEGESHGFRQASTIIKAIQSEYYFYSKIFKIEASDSLEPIEIFNL